MPEPKKAPKTFADLLAMKYCGNYELIRGEICEEKNTTGIYQFATGCLLAQLFGKVRGRACVCPVPLHAVLFADSTADFPQANTAVLPDVALCCDGARITEDGCIGAPDLVIELVSPATEVLDRVTKFDLYEEAGVREYWLLDLWKRTLSVYLSSGKLFSKCTKYDSPEVVPVSVLRGESINLDLVFHF